MEFYEAELHGQLGRGAPQDQCVVVRVNPRYDFDSWLRNNEDWGDFKAVAHGWIAFKKHCAQNYPHVILEDQWSEGGIRMTPHEEIKFQDKWKKIKKRNSALDARSTSSGAALWATGGNRCAIGPKQLGELSHYDGCKSGA